MNARAKLAASFRAALADHMIWHPVSDAPEEGTVSIVSDYSRNAGAVFKGGKWARANGSALPFEPSVWLEVRK